MEEVKTSHEASVSPFKGFSPCATIYPHPHEFSRHSARSLDFRLYRPVLKHPSLSLSSLERPSAPRLCRLRVCFYLRPRGDGLPCSWGKGGGGRSTALLSSSEGFLEVPRLSFLRLLHTLSLSFARATCHLGLSFTLRRYVLYISCFWRTQAVPLLRARETAEIHLYWRDLCGRTLRMEYTQ